MLNYDKLLKYSAMPVLQTNTNMSAPAMKTTQEEDDTTKAPLLAKEVGQK